MAGEARPYQVGRNHQSRMDPAGRRTDLQTITTLRNQIRDLGDEVDSYKAKTAGAMGGGVFLLLLAVGGAYDVINHNMALSNAIGISQAAFRWLVVGLGGGGCALLVLGVIRQWRRDRERETRLANIEQELARLEEEEP
jgi:hypothetical protein